MRSGVPRLRRWRDTHCGDGRDGELVSVGGPAKVFALMALADDAPPVGIADPTSYGSALLILGGVALVAGYVPAMRASRVNPSVTLRDG